jgi:hypothetical protein
MYQAGAPRSVFACEPWPEASKNSLLFAALALGEGPYRCLLPELSHVVPEK